ncbi:MAG: hypothetical protein NZ699_03005 [Roseiflexus sp.]|nr:hypothetical protein [Roseiflexus sp.]MDW8147161.1 hypothetical protein [Roseiflexaceae bacterium]MDW8231561.1 hypothetical protein [Roseiflexaceae bacterium]
MRISTSIALAGEEAALLLTTLRDGALWRTLALFALLLTLAAQLPLHSAIDVGREDGVGSDLPLVRGMFPVEESPYGLFRWTTEHAIVRLPGIGQRPLALTVRVLAVNDEVATRGARELEFWSSGQRLASLPVRQSGAIYRLLIPPPADWSGDHQIEIRSATITPTGDRRAVGTPLTTIALSAGTGPALPPWRSTLIWIGAGLALWVTLRRAGFGQGVAQAIMLPLMALAATGAWLDPPRFAFGAAPALVALTIGWALVVMLCAAPETLRRTGLALAAITAAAWLADWRGPVIDLGRATVHLRAVAGLAALTFLAAAATRPALAGIAARLGIAVPAAHWRWLLLIVVIVFATRYGGKIYPDSMPGDIGFHANRFADAAFGRILLVSRNRGVDFPYPPAFYLILAPFTLLDIERRAVLHLGAALLDAFSPLLVYTLATALQRGYADASSRLAASRSFPAPLVAAALYGLTPAGYLTTWWNFSTHIFTQFAHLLMITILVVTWQSLQHFSKGLTQKRNGTKPRNHCCTPFRPRAFTSTFLGNPPDAASEDAASAHSPPVCPPRRTRLFMALVTVQLFVYLGHFGFWINTSLLGGFGLATLIVLALQRRLGALQALACYGAAFATAQTVAVLFFYSAYTGMFVQQLTATMTGGLTGLAGRAPTPVEALWRTLWDAGFRQHYGFFPLALLPAGIVWLVNGAAARSGYHRAPAAILATGTIVVACGFAVLPFLSGSTLATRWLMFSAWLAAIGAAVGAAALWRRGWAGRITVLVAGGYVVWVTAGMWLAALLWRIRPPEPF